MRRSLGVCPKCFSENVQPLRGVLRKCKNCGKHFGQPMRRRPLWLVPSPIQTYPVGQKA
jgi:hypothetical protein